MEIIADSVVPKTIVKPITNATRSNYG